MNTAKTEIEVYPYSIDVLLIQQVSLLRDPKQTTYAVPWSTGGVGSIELLDYYRSLQTGVDRRPRGAVGTFAEPFRYFVMQYPVHSDLRIVVGNKQSTRNAGRQ